MQAHPVHQIVKLGVTNGNVAVGGDDNLQVSSTTRHSDYLCFLAYILIHAPKMRLQNQSLRLEVITRAVYSAC